MEFTFLNAFIVSVLGEATFIFPSLLIILNIGIWFLETGELFSNDFWILVSVVSFGFMIGSIFLYGVGLIMRMPTDFVLKKVFNFKFFENNILKGKKEIYDWTYFVCRMTPLLPARSITLVAGFLKYPFHKFFLLGILGTFIRVTVIFSFSVIFKDLYQSVFNFFGVSNDLSIIVLIILTIFAPLIFIYGKRRFE